jgi:hypothetical protein
MIARKFAGRKAPQIDEDAGHYLRYTVAEGEPGWARKQHIMDSE